MEEKMKLSPEDLEKIAGGDLGGVLNEGDYLYLDMFMAVYKARGFTMDGFISEMVSIGCGDAAVSYIMSNWDRV